MEMTENATANNVPNYTGNSFGSILKKAREKKGISLEDVSKELFIKARQLQAIEEENFEALPEHAFSHGFVKNYAKYLGLNEHEVVAIFDDAYPAELKAERTEDIESPLKPMGTLNRENGRSIRFNPLLLLSILGVLALAMFLFRTVNNAESEANEPEQVETTINEQEQQQGASLQGAESVSASGSALNLDNGNTQNQSTQNQPMQNQTPAVAQDADNAQVAQAGEPVVKSAEGNDAVELWVRGETNVTIVDANGQTIMSGTHGRGGYTVKGTAPFKMQIDKADNVAINLNKQPVKLGQYTQNNQANFELK